jgi:hypothetical protein
MHWLSFSIGFLVALALVIGIVAILATVGLPDPPGMSKAMKQFHEDLGRRTMTLEWEEEEE